MSVQAILKDLREIFGPVGVLTMAQLAQYLGRSVEAVRKMKERGGLPVQIKIVGGRPCVALLAVAQWLGEEDSLSQRVEKHTAQPIATLKPQRKMQNIGKMLLMLQIQQQGISELHSELENLLLTLQIKADDKQ